MGGFSLSVSWEFCCTFFAGNLSTQSGSKPFGNLINILPRCCEVCCRQEMTVASPWAREEQGLTSALTYSSKIALLVSQNKKWIRRENWLIIPSLASGQSSYLLFVVWHTKHILPRQIGGQGPCPEEHTIYGADPARCCGPSQEEWSNFISGWFWHILGGLTSLANTNGSSDPRGWLL